MKTEYAIKAPGPALELPKEPSEWTRYASWLQQNNSVSKSSAAGNSRYHSILTEGKLYRIDRAAGAGPDGVVAVRITIPVIPKRIAWGDGRLWLAATADKKFSLHSIDPRTLDCRQECSFSIEGASGVSVCEWPFITKDAVYFTLFTGTFSFFVFDRHAKEVKSLIRSKAEQFSTRDHAADGIRVAGGDLEVFVYRDGRGKIPLARHPQIRPLLPLVRQKLGWSDDYTDYDVAEQILHIDFENGMVYLCGEPAMGADFHWYFFAYNRPLFRLPFGAKSVDEVVCCWKGPHDASRAARDAHSVFEVDFPPDVGCHAYFSGKYAVAPACLGTDCDYVYITGQGSVIDLGALDILCDTAGLIDDVFYGEQRCLRDGVEPGWKQIVLSETGPTVRPIVLREEEPDKDEADFTLEAF